MHSQGGDNLATGANFEFGSATATAGGYRPGGKPNKGGPLKAIGGIKQSAIRDDVSKVQPKGTRFQSKDKQVQMSPKVLETWINETL